MIRAFLAWLRGRRVRAIEARHAEVHAVACMVYASLPPPGDGLHWSEGDREQVGAVSIADNGLGTLALPQDDIG